MDYGTFKEIFYGFHWIFVCHSGEKKPKNPKNKKN